VPISKRWLVAGTLVMIGAMWFTSRALLALDLATKREAWWFVVAFAIGAFAGGAVIARHSSVRAWCESVIAAALSVAFMIVIARAGRDANNSVAGPVAIMSLAQLALASVVAFGAAYAGARLGRRVTSSPSAPAVIVLSGLLINGAMTFTMGTISAIAGTHRFSGAIVPVVFLAIAAGGFATQAVVAEKRPWTCASGGVLLLLLFAQKDGRGSIAAGAFAVGALTLMGWVGARIAVRVFRDRWQSAPSTIPEARVER
jgi:hypothetical protein